MIQVKRFQGSPCAAIWAHRSPQNGGPTRDTPTIHERPRLSLRSDGRRRLPKRPGAHRIPRSTLTGPLPTIRRPEAPP
eukprot:816935-Pyramimonas_sp.AAC.1